MVQQAAVGLAIASLVFTGLALLASLGLTILGFVKLRRHATDGPASIKWLKATMVLTTIWMVLFLSSLVAPDTSLTVGLFDKNNPNFHVTAVSSIIGLTTFVAYLFTQIEVIRDSMAAGTLPVSRTWIYIIFGAVLVLNAIRFILAELTLLARKIHFSFACNVIDNVTIFILLGFGIITFVLLIRARDTIGSKVFKYLVAACTITCLRLSYQAVYTLLHLLTMYAVNIGPGWIYFMTVPTIFFSSWSMIVGLALLYRVASLEFMGQNYRSRLPSDAEKGLNESD